MVLPLDMPDDYPWLPGSGKSTLGDLGELAARLGSIVTYDRRGSVYWLDDFENGLAPWLPGGAGTGWDVRIVNDPTFRGGYSCRLTSGSNASKSAVILKRLAPSLISTYGLEATFSFSSDVRSLNVTFQYNNGLIKQVATINVHFTNQELTYYASDQTFTNIDTIIISGTDKYTFSTLKMVIDLENNKYVRVLYNQKEYDISDSSIYTVSDTSHPRIEASIALFSEGSTNAIAYVDSVIITVGDP